MSFFSLVMLTSEYYTDNSGAWCLGSVLYDDAYRNCFL